MNAMWQRPWIRRAVLGVGLLIALAPLFGWASTAVGYAEPLENAAATTGAIDAATTVYAGLFPGYSLPMLGGPAGTLVAGLVGAVLTLTSMLAAGRLLEQ